LQSWLGHCQQRKTRKKVSTNGAENSAR